MEVGFKEGGLIIPATTISYSDKFVKVGKGAGKYTMRCIGDSVTRV